MHRRALPQSRGFNSWRNFVFARKPFLAAGLLFCFLSHAHADPASCPANSSPAPSGGCECSSGYQQGSSGTTCFPASPEPATSKLAGSRPVAGLGNSNSILPATAENYRSETDWLDAGPGALFFKRIYRSNWAADSSRAGNPLGQVWSHNYSTKLLATPATAPHAVAITTAEGHVRTFDKPAGATAWTASDSADTLVQQPSGTWTYQRADDDVTFSFDGSGKLQTETARNGWARIYAYNGAGQLASVANGFGRIVTFTYNGAGQLMSVTTPDARVIAYAYDGTGRLSSVLYPDGRGRGFVYENASFPQGLTGIFDEAGMRWGTFAYDSTGRAVSAELAGSVDRYQVSYPSTGSANVIDPLGTNRSYSYSTNKGKLAVVGSSLPSGEGEGDAASRVQDANGLITSETDFNGVTTLTTWDAVRRLPTRVDYAVGTPDVRIVTTQWHPTFSLPMLVLEPWRSTTYTYDPFGNRLSMTVTEGATGKTQAWQWTYNAQQLVATETAPNGGVTGYAYDPLGNLTSSVNALGHETVYAYNSANRVISSTAPNGLVTTYTYDARDRLTTRNVGGQQVTMFGYTPYGEVEAIGLPTGLMLSYTRDAAHRLIGWNNNRGESGDYTLDGMGNRRLEEIKNSTGNVAWSATRMVNYINRLAARIEGGDQANHFDYDANGELVREANGLAQSTAYGLDSLRRVTTITNAASLTAILRYNALNAVTQARDFKGVFTDYVRDAQGNATSESSPDVGTIATQYDALGLPSQIIDALGQATFILRDPLGRPTLLVFADGKSTTLRYDFTLSSKGYLSEIVDRSGTTEYFRDAFGRVFQKRQTLANGSVQEVSYEYSPNGRLTKTFYPGGSELTYIYGIGGRVTALNWNGAPLVTDIAWNPMGQPTSWNWAIAPFALGGFRSYDTAGRLIATEFSNYAYDTAGRITSLTQHLYQPDDADPTHSTFFMAPKMWSVGYNAVGRITAFDTADSTTGFEYDANGNPLSSMRVVDGQSTSRIYALGGMTNQLGGFTQVMGGTSTSVTYGYNANGDLVSDGLRSYTYDASGRLAAATTGATDVSPTTRYAHNALGQRVFKTEPLYPPSQGNDADPGFMQSLIAFFTKLWSPSTTQAEQLGYAYAYDEQGTLIAEMGSGGTNSAGQSQYIYLPTASGPMPVAAVINGNTYAVHSDHLNTPRKLTNANGQAVWQWSYSAFGEDKPTMARNRFANLETTPNPGTTNISEVKFNLRYPGQYADEESGLFYSDYRSYDARTGRYSQPDPMGLDGGWNRYGYANENPVSYVDPKGLDAAALIGGPKPGTPLGLGMPSDGTRTPLGPRLMDCLGKQSNDRNANVIVIPKTSEQGANRRFCPASTRELG